MHQLFASGSQNIESLASASVLPKHVQGLFPLRLTSLISMLSKALSRLFQHHSLKTSILQCPAFFIVQLSHLHMTTEKTMAWTIRTFVSKVMSLLFNTPSRLVTAFLPRNNQLLISLLQSSSTVILEHKKRKYVTASMFSPSICHEVMGPDAMILVVLIRSFQQAFSLSSFTLIRQLFNSCSLSVIGVVSSTYLRLLIFLLEIWILVCNPFSPAFCMMCSVCKLNKQGDNK